MVGKSYAQAVSIAAVLLQGKRVLLHRHQPELGERTRRLVGEVLKAVGADQSLLDNLEVRHE